MAKLPRDDNNDLSYAVSYNRPIHYGLTVGTSAVQVTSPRSDPYKSLTHRTSVLIQSHPDNTGKIAIGFDNSVIVGTGDEAGFILDPGDSHSVDLAASSQGTQREVFLISDTAAQDIRVQEV